MCLEETVTRGVIEPRVIVRTTHARLEVNRLPGNLLGSEFTAGGYPTSRITYNDALLPPWLKVLRFGDRAWVLDPLDDLGHRDEIDVVVLGEDLVDPIEEGFQKFRIVLQPSSVEVKTKRGTILIVMPVEIVIEEIVELVTGENVATGVNHRAAWQILVVLRIFPAIQLVHHHFPDRVRSENRKAQQKIFKSSDSCGSNRSC